MNKAIEAVLGFIIVFIVLLAGCYVVAVKELDKSLLAKLKINKSSGRSE